ncbi:4294_t:CDS:2, partial [Funneliformis geosporum]
EQAANAALIIGEKNPTTLVEINDQVLRLAKSSKDLWWWVLFKNASKYLLKTAIYSTNPKMYNA